MFAIAIPKDASPITRTFLFGWSMCMQSFMHMEEKDKQLVKAIFEQLIPEANCPEARALDEALLAYVLHKCGEPEGVGSQVPRGNA